MLTTVEGVYSHGNIELKERPAGIQEGRVLVTFLHDDEDHRDRRPMVFGQFAGPQTSTEDDFRLAEWRGEETD